MIIGSSAYGRAGEARALPLSRLGDLIEWAIFADSFAALWLALLLIDFGGFPDNAGFTVVEVGDRISVYFSSLCFA